jgi:hypothetical protein
MGLDVDALSATMMLATDPNNVRFPAKVEAIASSFQPSLASGRVAISSRTARMKGTLETTLDPTKKNPGETHPS